MANIKRNNLQLPQSTHYRKFHLPFSNIFKSVVLLNALIVFISFGLIQSGEYLKEFFIALF